MNSNKFVWNMLKIVLFILFLLNFNFSDWSEFGSVENWSTDKKLGPYLSMQSAPDMLNLPSRHWVVIDGNLGICNRDKPSVTWFSFPGRCLAFSHMLKCKYGNSKRLSSLTTYKVLDDKQCTAYITPFLSVFIKILMLTNCLPQLKIVWQYK